MDTSPRLNTALANAGFISLISLPYSVKTTKLLKATQDILHT